MHFAIATAILVQTIHVPTTSAKPDDVLLPRRAERRRRMQGMFMKHADGSMVAPIESPLLQLNYHETDEHMPAFADRSPVQISRVLNNTKHSSSRVNKKAECDPSLEDLDVGILSCGMGQRCEESADSLLGGLCEFEASSFSRILQEDQGESAMTYYCETKNCDCDLVNGETETGTILCNPYDDCCDPDDLFCVTTTYVIDMIANQVSSWSGCYDFTSPYSRSVCYTHAFSTDGTAGTCVMNVDNEACTSCNIVLDGDGWPCAEFDCTNIDVDEAVAGKFCDGGPVPIHDLFYDSLAILVCPTDATTSASNSKSAAKVIVSAVVMVISVVVVLCILIAWQYRRRHKSKPEVCTTGGDDLELVCVGMT